MDLKPGIYRATVRGQENVLGVVMESASHCFYSVSLVDDCAAHGIDRFVTDARPLVVLDLSVGYGGEIDLAIETLRDTNHTAGGIRSLIADQIEAQTKPPRIPEPGWGEKVVAHTGVGGKRREFIRFAEDKKAGCEYHWFGRGDLTACAWDDLIDPVLVRDGVES